MVMRLALQLLSGCWCFLLFPIRPGARPLAQLFGVCATVLRLSPATKRQRHRKHADEFIFGFQTLCDGLVPKQGVNIAYTA